MHVDAVTTVDWVGQQFGGDWIESDKFDSLSSQAPATQIWFAQNTLTSWCKDIITHEWLVLDFTNGYSRFGTDKLAALLLFRSLDGGLHGQSFGPFLATAADRTVVCSLNVY